MNQFNEKLTLTRKQSDWLEKRGWFFRKSNLKILNHYKFKVLKHGEIINITYLDGHVYRMLQNEEPLNHYDRSSQ